jgi:hypothetical protein
LTAAVLLCWPGYLPAYADTPEFRLLAWPSKQTVTSTGQALIHVDLVNIGTVAVTRCYDNAAPSHAEMDFTVHIRDSHGNSPRLTEAGDQLFHSERYNDVIIVHSTRCETFAPSQIRSETLLLNPLYILEPGQTYTVSFAQKQKRLAAKEPADSNDVTVTVR